MIIIYGVRFYGAIKAAGRSTLRTHFVHAYFVPLFPIGTYLVLEENVGGLKSIKTKLSLKSVLAAYLRVWAPILAVTLVPVGLAAAFFAGLSSHSYVAAFAAGLGASVIVLVLVLGAIWGWVGIGKLSIDEQKRYAAFARHIGYAVDPADMGDARYSLRVSLMAEITERLRGMVAMGYRLNADPAAVWPYVALDPSHNDESLLTAAFTLAQLDASLWKKGPEKLQREQLRDELWQRIVQSNVCKPDGGAVAGRIRSYEI
jgi:hypothetical protein